MTAVPTETAPPVTAPPVIPLSRTHDRCDRCGSQAFVRASVLSTEGHPTDLLFCKHHFEKGETALRAIALSIQDERSRINEKPGSGVAE